jgi:uncharacterized protein (TIGR00645 family)
MGSRFNPILRAVMLASRWAMAPLCLGLIAALVIVIVQFGRELVHIVMNFVAMRGAEVILAVLKLVDLVLIANLLLMIISAGTEIFLPTAAADGTERPHTAGIAEFAALKPKLFASIGAIAAIDLLESFVNIESVDKATVLWEIVILLAFVVSGVLLAWMDQLEERH